MESVNPAIAYWLRIIAFILISLCAVVYDRPLALLIYLTGLVIWHMRTVEEHNENPDAR